MTSANEDHDRLSNHLVALLKEAAAAAEINAVQPANRTVRTVSGQETRQNDQALRIRNLEVQADQLRSELAAVYSSTSWQITKPLRALARRLPALTVLRRAMRSAGVDVSPATGSPNLGASTFALSEALALLVDRSDVSAAPAPVTIIVPVYNGLHHLKRLIPSLVRNTDPRHPIVLVDDCSPDPSVWPYLQEVAANHPHLEVRKNSQNCGFAATVNSAAEGVCGHFIILNTDTDVPPMWVERLMSPIFTDARVASTTPFSNAATIFSFPTTLIDNTILGASVADVDRAFMTITPDDSIGVDAPTGVGFCMGINGTLWQSIGGFDAAEFGRGYGEENDWCRRAAANGRRNIIVPNLFVYHAHGGSFLSDLKQGLQRENGGKLLRRWPDYDDLVRDHVTRDPWKPLRLSAFLKLCLSSASRPLLIFDHAIGGGANHYRHQQVQEALQAGRSALCITYQASLPGYVVDVTLGDHHEKFVASSLEELHQLARHLENGEIVFNNIVSWPAPMDVVAAITDVARASRNSRLIVLYHDYFSVCPSCHLLGKSGTYCGLPDKQTDCEKCLPNNPYVNATTKSIVIWRREWKRLLDAASEIRCFSKSSIDLVTRVWHLPPHKLTLVPHKPLIEYEERPLTLERSSTLVIGVVGSIGLAKGAAIVARLAELAANKSRNMKVIVFGDFDPGYLPKDNTALTILGRYDQGALPELLEVHKVQVCLVPSIIPETFSYVTQELMALKMPLASFNLGAQGERIKDYEHGMVVNEVTAEGLLHAALTLHGRRTSLASRPAA